MGGPQPAEAEGSPITSNETALRCARMARKSVKKLESASKRSAGDDDVSLTAGEPRTDDDDVSLTASELITGDDDVSLIITDLFKQTCPNVTVRPASTSATTTMLRDLSNVQARAKTLESFTGLIMSRRYYLKKELVTDGLGK
jgi:hypothetical protein